MIWLQRAATAFFVCSLCVFVFGLLQKSELQRHNFLPRGELVQIRPVELQAKMVADGLIEHHATMRIEENFPLGVRSISFWIATWGQQLAFSQANLNLGSPACNMSRDPGIVKDNSYLTFFLPSDCNPVGAVTAQLTLLSHSKSKIALWCKELTGDWLPTSALKVKVTSAEGKYLGYALGEYARKQSMQESRLNVLLGTWALKERTVFIFLIAFTVLIALTFINKSHLAASNRWLIKTTATFVILGALWCVVVPPFQAPDEPDHLMSFMDLTKTRDKLGPAMLSFAQRTHFERVKFNDTETISFLDLNESNQAPWAGHIAGPDYNERAPLLAFYAKQLSHIGIETVSIETIVVLLRLTNLFLIFLSLILCAKFIQAPSLSMVYFLAPPLFFFGMHVSNYPISLAVLLPAIASGILAFFARDRISLLRSLFVVPLAGVSAFYLNKTTAQLFPFFALVIALSLGTLIGDRFAWLKKLMGDKVRKFMISALVVAVILCIVLGTKFSPLPSVEQPPYALVPIKHAFKASVIYISNIFGFGNDYFITYTFWNGLGWLDVKTTETVALFNRYFWLVLAASAVFLRTIQTRKVQASKLVIPIFALALSVGFLSYSLQTKVTVNLSGRFLLPTYIAFFASIVFLLQDTFERLSEGSMIALKNALLLLGASFNLLYLSAVLVRYYS